MPELPEVETVARDLRPLIQGRTLLEVVHSSQRLRQKWHKSWDGRITGCQVAGVQRRGKWLLMQLASEGYLMVHLGMTGQLSVVDGQTPRESHTYVTFRLENGQELRFRDIRRFGSITYFPDSASWQKFLAGRLGPEPWDMPEDRWRTALGKTRRSLKALLLDQTVIAGVGNIYADESCFAARLDPRRSGQSLQKREGERLLRSIRAVLERAIEFRGSTIRNYVGGSGLQGKFQDEFAVYGRFEEPCTKCGTPIDRIRLAGRSTHFCPRCQR